MEEHKKYIKQIGFFIFVLFSLLVLSLLRFVIFESSERISSSYNRRLNLLDNTVKRGNIFDQEGNLLVTSVLDGEVYERQYRYPREFSHTIGYMELGKAGIEAKYNFDLQNIDKNILQRVYNVVFGTALQGDSLTLTLDLELQKLAYDLLGEKRGAIVVMEPSTGKILSMLSYPNYDSSSVLSDWEILSNDTDNSPLLNRATQGLYPPGSVYKMIPALAALENQHADLTFYCEGFIEIGDARIRCFDSHAHGNLNLFDAVAFSCNTTFSWLGNMLGTEILRSTSERFLLNKPISYPLEYSVSAFPLQQNADEHEILQTSIGQGRTVVTPLHMALLTSGIANNGIIMKPYLVDHMIGFDGTIKQKNIPELLTQVTTAENTEILTDMMISVVEKGTARGLKIDGVEIAAKTGTAENHSGDAHGWLVAFAPAKKPQVVVSVLLENSGGSIPCQSIAKELIAHVLMQ